MMWCVSSQVDSLWASNLKTDFVCLTAREHVDVEVSIISISVRRRSPENFQLFFIASKAVAMKQIICGRNKPECHYFTSCWVQSFGSSGLLIFWLGFLPNAKYLADLLIYHYVVCDKWTPESLTGYLRSFCRPVFTRWRLYVHRDAVITILLWHKIVLAEVLRRVRQPSSFYCNAGNIIWIMHKMPATMRKYDLILTVTHKVHWYTSEILIFTSSCC